MKTIKIILGVVVLVAGIGVAALWYGVYGKNFKGEFLLVNKAQESISRASVEVCGQKIELKDIQVGKSATGSFKPKCEGHYSIQVDFLSGKKLQKETGYITGGFDYWHEIEVSAEDIKIEDSKVERKK